MLTWILVVLRYECEQQQQTKGAVMTEELRGYTEEDLRTRSDLTKDQEIFIVANLIESKKSEVKKIKDVYHECITAINYDLICVDEAEFLENYCEEMCNKDILNENMWSDLYTIFHDLKVKLEKAERGENVIL